MIKSKKTGVILILVGSFVLFVSYLFTESEARVRFRLNDLELVLKEGWHAKGTLIRWSSIVKDPEFQSLELPQKQKVLNGYLRDNVESDPEYQALPSESKAMVRHGFERGAGIAGSKIPSYKEGDIIGRIVFPYKYILAIVITLIFTGIGIILLNSRIWKDDVKRE